MLPNPQKDGDIEIAALEELRTPVRGHDHPLKTERCKLENQSSAIRLLSLVSALAKPAWKPENKS